MPTTTSTELRSTIVRIVLESGEGEITESDLAAADWSLTAVGYTSLSYIRMIDAVENELGVYLDPEAETERFATIDGIIGLVVESSGDGDE